MNEYLREKERAKNAVKVWYIFVPVWFVSTILAWNIADAIQGNHHLIATLLRFVPIIAIPVWVYVAIRVRGFQGPAHLKCLKCNTPAFDRSYDIDWKFEGPTRDFKDICPNCGNDNRIDFHDP